ncbi:hypothetical protein FB107DRAFT_279346 [Schizophyllum commune]
MPPPPNIVSVAQDVPMEGVEDEGSGPHVLPTGFTIEHHVKNADGTVVENADFVTDTCHLESLFGARLKEICKDLNLPHSYSKKPLIKQLKQHSKKGQVGWKEFYAKPRTRSHRGPTPDKPRRETLSAKPQRIYIEDVRGRGADSARVAQRVDVAELASCTPETSSAPRSDARVTFASPLPPAHAALSRCREDALIALAAEIAEPAHGRFPATSIVALFDSCTPRLRSCALPSVNFDWQYNLCSTFPFLLLAATTPTALPRPLRPSRRPLCMPGA